MSKSFPRNPNLRHFKDQARDLQRAIKAGDASARGRVRVSHPRYAGGEEVPVVAGRSEGDFSLSDAQLTVAREYGFASWGKLRECTLTIERYGCRPHDEPARLAGGRGGAIEAGSVGELANDFLRLACLTYGVDNPARRKRAAELWAAHPEIAEGNIHVRAALGDAEGVRKLLAEDSSRARAVGGPHGWEPLLYLTYGRMPGTEAGAAVEAARLLLAQGADANAGFLWDNEMYVFTALTGVLGEGEAGPVNQPRHVAEEGLARLLLEAGADANDGQGLYNRQFTRGAGHLELLLEYGLGKPGRGPWAERLGGRGPEPEGLVRDQLMWAAEHGHLDRVRVLAAAGVNLEAVDRQGRTAYQVARLNGQKEIAEYLKGLGVETGTLAVAEELCAALQGADGARVAELRAEYPQILENLGERKQAGQLIAAAGADRREAVELMLGLGFPVNVTWRSSALHEAAWNGRVEMARLLLAHGADREQRDPTHDARPVDWARYNGQGAVAEVLEGD